MSRRIDGQREYKLLNTVTSDETFCFADSSPDGPYVPLHRMKRGESIAAKYPEDQYSVELKLDPDWPGLKLPSLIGNAGRLVILHKDVVGFIKDGFEAEPFETFSFTLINHKGRVHSKDYVFFSPLALHECLHGIDDDPEVFDQRLIIERRKLADVGDIFRVREKPSKVLVSERLAEALVAKGFTNFEFTDVLYNER